LKRLRFYPPTCLHPSVPFVFFFSSFFLYSLGLCVMFAVHLFFPPQPASFHCLLYGLLCTPIFPLSFSTISFVALLLSPLFRDYFVFSLVVTCFSPSFRSRVDWIFTLFQQVYFIVVFLVVLSFCPAYSLYPSATHLFGSFTFPLRPSLVPKLLSWFLSPILVLVGCLVRLHVATFAIRF